MTVMLGHSVSVGFRLRDRNWSSRHGKVDGTILPNTALYLGSRCRGQGTT